MYIQINCLGKSSVPSIMALVHGHLSGPPYSRSTWFITLSKINLLLSELTLKRYSINRTFSLLHCNTALQIFMVDVSHKAEIKTSNFHFYSIHLVVTLCLIKSDVHIIELLTLHQDRSHGNHPFWPELCTFSWLISEKKTFQLKTEFIAVDWLAFYNGSFDFVY